MNKKLDLDSFGEIMDKFLEENEIQMLLTMPEGTQDVQVKDNAGIGPVVQFYIMLKGITTICNDMQKLLGIDALSPEWEQVVDALLAMVKQEIVVEDKR